MPKKVENKKPAKGDEPAPFQSLFAPFAETAQIKTAETAKAEIAKATQEKPSAATGFIDDKPPPGIVVTPIKPIILPAPETSPEPPRQPDGTDVFTDAELLGSEEFTGLGAAPPDPAASPDDGVKTRGRPKGSRNRPAFEDVVAAAVNYRKMSEMTFDMSTGILTNVFGPEWQPKSPEEREGVVKPLEDYYRSKQMPDLPPGMILAIVATAYCAPRFQAPATRGKMQSFFAWVKSKIGRRKKSGVLSQEDL